MPRTISTFLLICLSFIVSYSQQSEKVDLSKFKTSIQDKLDSLYDPDTDFGGAILGIALPDGQTCGFAVGLSEVENATIMDPSGRMPGGSTGKIFVSSSIMQLVEKGEIHLDDKTSMYFEDDNWFDRIQNSQTLTIRNLLQHSSGISRYVFNEQFQIDIKGDPDRIWHPEELLSYVLDEEPLFPPGTDFAYSDTNYIILGMILEKISGSTLYEYIDHNILVPHELANILPQTKRKIDGLVVGYSSENDEFFPGKVVEGGTYRYNWQFEWAGGGYLINASDLALAGKLIYEGQVFSKDLMDEFLSGIDAKRLGGQWGLGVHIKETPHGLSYGHSGFFPGYITNMLYFPDHRFSIAFQVNTSDGEKIGLYRKLYQMIPYIIEILGTDD